MERKQQSFFVMTLSVCMLKLLCCLSIRDILDSVRVHKYRVKFFCQTTAQYVRVVEAKVSAATLMDGWGLHMGLTLELPVTCCEVTPKEKLDIGLFI